MAANTSSGKERAGKATPSAVARVLVADRDPATRADVRRALEAGGLAVCAECADLPAVLSALVRLQPDVCLVDVGLPGGGIVAARAVASRSRTSRIVMLADVVRDQDVVASLEAGARGILAKRAEGSHLARAVVAAAGGRALIERSARPEQ